MDKSKLIADRVIGKTGTHHIDGVGTVKFRALSRMELLTAGELSERKSTLESERYVLSRAMLDPVLTEDDVRAWQEASPGMEINTINMLINELSGMRPRADKEQYKSVP